MNTGRPGFATQVRLMSSQSIHPEIVSRYGARVVTIRRRRRRVALQTGRSLLNLGRQYQDQARYTFVEEAVILGLIALVAIVWPAIHTVQIIAEAF